MKNHPAYQLPFRGLGGEVTKNPDNICRGSEYYSKSTGYAITIPERSLYATTNICLLPGSLYYKFAGENCYKQIFFCPQPQAVTSLIRI